jgi:chromosome segregation ATPase
MGIVKDVAEVVKLAGDVVKSTREMITAFNDGRVYLKRNYPDATNDLTELLEQMQQAIEGLASVTAVISGFRFSIAGNSVDVESAQRDLSRLNEYLIRQGEKTSSLRGSIRTLKANCEKVKELRDKLDARSKDRSWGSMFELFGAKSLERSKELHSALSNFYTEDQKMIDLLTDTLELTEKALAEVEEALGPPGTQNPYNVPVAAEVLGLYATLLRPTDKNLHNLADEMNKVRMALTT